MAANRPTILVVDNDRDERAAIAAALREAGFGVAAAARDRGATAALERKRFAAAIIALPDGGVEFLRRARRRQPGLQALIILEPAAMRSVDAGEAFVARPIDPRQLLSRIFELVLREPEERLPHGNAAEFGIAAAKLACLYRRRAAAAADGASRLARDLTRQIGETQALHHSLAAAIASGGLAVMY